MKIALFKAVNDGYTTVHNEGLDGSEYYIRISEYVDIDFPPLNEEESKQKEIDMLQKMLVESQLKCGKTIERLQKKIEELED